MRFHGRDDRGRVTTGARVSFPFILFIAALLVSPWLQVRATSQKPGASTALGNAPLSGEQVVDNLLAMNLERAHALHAYQGTRNYLLQYHGFAGNRSAEMVVDLKYQSPGTKEFTIRSSTGSKLIINKVFKGLLQAEQEALGVEAQKRTALNRDNYYFTLVGYDSKPSGSMYVLDVMPRTKGRFLYRGRIWVEAEDFAVTLLESQPAKNPSFWTKHSKIDEVYLKVGDFWLPARNHSVTSIRFGGSAVLTIQYQDYKITSADAVSNLR